MTNIAKNYYNDKSVDCVLGTWTRGGWMVSTDETTELWQHPQPAPYMSYNWVLKPKLSETVIDHRHSCHKNALCYDLLNLLGQIFRTFNLVYMSMFFKWAIHALFFLFFSSLYKVNSRYVI